MSEVGGFEKEVRRGSRGYKTVPYPARAQCLGDKPEGLPRRFSKLHMVIRRVPSVVDVARRAELCILQLFGTKIKRDLHIFSISVTGEYERKCLRSFCASVLVSLSAGADFTRFCYYSSLAYSTI